MLKPDGWQRSYCPHQEVKTAVQVHASKLCSNEVCFNRICNILHFIYRKIFTSTENKMMTRLMTNLFNIKKNLLHKFNTEPFTGFYTYPLVLGTEATTRPSCRQLKKHEKHNLRLNFKCFSGKTISNKVVFVASSNSQIESHQ